MRIIIVGATGNLGTSLLAQLARDDADLEIVGLARRAPEHRFPHLRFEIANVETDLLDPLFYGADAVVHLAWRLQPSHSLATLERTNIVGSQRVFEAAARANVRALIYASSIGAYASGPKDQFVDETWPTTGIPASLYSIQKARVERILDDVERSTPQMRVVRFRPALIFKREAASDVLRLFFGPWVPRLLLGPRGMRFIPDHPRLRFQCVHSLDVGEAFRLAIYSDLRGAFNLAADPVIDPELLADMLEARRIPVSRALMRRLVSLSWHLRLQRSETGWVDLALDSPLIDSTRARTALGWQPRHTADAALLELIAGLREGAGFDTPPLAPRRGFRRFREADSA